MLNENLKILRKRKGFTQEQLAQALNVIRQTVSKWENGLSVPDASMLIKLAETLDVSVNDLIGSTIETAENEDSIAKELARINQQLAIKNNRTRKFIHVIIAVLAAFLVIGLLLFLLNLSGT